MRKLTLALPLLVSIALAGGASGAGAPLQVVTATTDLASIARAIGGKRVEVTSIAAASQDAHFIEAKPSLMLRLRKADLYVTAGMELGIGWEEPLLRGARNTSVRPGEPGYLDASEGIVALEVPSGGVDRSQGDIHALGNPHYWLDPWNGRQVAASIARRLGQLSPTDRATFEAGLAAFQRRLDEAMFGAALVEAVGGEKLWKLASTGDLQAGLTALSASRPGLPPLRGWAARMAPHSGTGVVTYHRSWSYFLNRFGLQLVGEIEPKPGIPPTPSHLLGLVERAKAERAGVVLAEPWYAAEAPTLVASKVGVPVLRLALSTGGNGAGDDYIEHLDHVVEAVAGALASARSRT